MGEFSYRPQESECPETKLSDVAAFEKDAIKTRRPRKSAWPGVFSRLRILLLAAADAAGRLFGDVLLLDWIDLQRDQNLQRRTRRRRRVAGNTLPVCHSTSR
jgi:hypothetical protein